MQDSDDEADEEHDKEDELGSETSRKDYPIMLIPPKLPEPAQLDLSAECDGFASCSDGNAYKDSVQWRRASSVFDVGNFRDDARANNCQRLDGTRLDDARCYLPVAQDYLSLPLGDANQDMLPMQESQSMLPVQPVGSSNYELLPPLPALDTWAS